MKAMRMNAPGPTPAAPRPAIARPMINVVLFFAMAVEGWSLWKAKVYSIAKRRDVPQIRLLSSKMKMEIR